MSIDISAFLNWKWRQAGFPGNRVEGEVEASPLVVGEGVVASLPLDPSLWSLVAHVRALLQVSLSS